MNLDKYITSKATAESLIRHEIFGGYFIPSKYSELVPSVYKAATNSYKQEYLYTNQEYLYTNIEKFSDREDLKTITKEAIISNMAIENRIFSFPNNVSEYYTDKESVKALLLENPKHMLLESRLFNLNKVLSDC